MSVRRFHLFFCCLALVLHVSFSVHATAQKKVQTATQLEQQRAYPKAEEAWREITTDDPQNAMAWAHLGLVRAMEGKYAEAVPAYRKALQLDPRQTGVQLNLGLALFKQQHFQEA